VSRLEAVFSETWPRLVATLVRRFGDLDVAEEAAGEAVAAAVEHWAVDGLPPNPAGWLTTTATRKAVDRLRREANRAAKHQEALMLAVPPASTGPVDDDTLRLMFVCCHPALAPEARVALTLRLVAGLTTAEIARAFLVPETTMAQRLTRAKRKVRDARIPFRTPARSDLPERVGGVLAVLYLVFNEGYLAGAGEDPIRADLTAEAIRLARLLRTLLPEDGEVAGLLALMLLTEARRPARLSDAGELVMIDEQDRSGWDSALIDEGRTLVAERVAASYRGEEPGRYQLQAAIGAVHTSAPEFRATDWGQIVQLYDRLLAIDPSPVVALNRAVAVAELDGPAVGLTLVDELPLAGYHAWHATRAELLRRLGRSGDARAEYGAAIAATANPAEQRYLGRRRDSLAVE
jgi:RNA polymerase sigma-70 factor (ECF subfamily)